MIHHLKSQIIRRKKLESRNTVDKKKIDDARVKEFSNTE